MELTIEVFTAGWFYFMTSASVGHPERGASLRSKFQEHKRANQFWHWCSVNDSSP